MSCQLKVLIEEIARFDQLLLTEPMVQRSRSHILGKALMGESLDAHTLDKCLRVRKLHLNGNSGWSSSAPAAVNRPCLYALLRENDRVDDVDHPVRGDDVRLYDLGVVDHDRSVLRSDRQRLAINRLRSRDVHDICGHYFAWHDVIGQNGLQLRFVLRF